MVDRVRAAAKLRHEDSRSQRRMEVYSKARGVDAEGTSEISVEAFKKALIHLESNTQQSLPVLKKAFVQDPAHIVTFLRHKSALHFIIGRLISGDPYEQLEAMECCCNASLGDAKSCSLVANAGAIYMIQIVHGTNVNLIKVALTTLGNLSMASGATCKLLHEQGLVPALLAALRVDETRELAAKALCQFTYTYLPHLSDADVTNCIECSLPFFEKTPEVQWLLAQLSAQEAGRVHLSATPVIPTTLRLINGVQAVTSDNLRSVTALIRFLANMAAHIPEGFAFSCSLEEAVSSCTYPFIRKEFEWLLSSIRSDTAIEMM
uniref:Transmembrane and coiled-coil domain-containing protein 6 n=1 Tax=Lygus hesperus TaxID=30085 RepID=A0A0A9XUN9_LYGHE